MDPRAAATLRPLGVPDEPFAARRLTVSLVNEADLVLTAERPHRAEVVAGRPGAHAKVFTLREFERLLGFLDPGRIPAGDLVSRARSLVDAAARMRGLCPPAGPGEDDLTDPFDGTLRDFESCAAVIDGALHRLLRFLSPLDRRPGRADRPAAADHSGSPLGA